MSIADGIDVAAATRDGTLVIDGVQMARKAFAVLDLWPLLDGPEQRGEDTRIPGRPGVLSNPRRADTTTRSLRMVIDGRWRVDGTASDDPRTQVWTTVRYLRTNVADPTYLTDGTRTVTITLRDGTVLSGACTVGPLRLGEQAGPVVRATLQITMPDGELAQQ